jgi:hypothetical protein
MFQGAENPQSLYIAKVDAPIRALEENDDAEYLPLGVHGSTLYVSSDKNAPNLPLRTWG